MTFTLKKASDWNFEDEITISSLEELMNLIERCGCDVIVSKNKITICDDYME